MEELHNVPVKIFGQLVGTATVGENGNIELKIDANSPMAKIVYAQLADGACTSINLTTRAEPPNQIVIDYDVKTGGGAHIHMDRSRYGYQIGNGNIQSNRF